jgi:hypothetical protein
MTETFVTLALPDWPEGRIMTETEKTNTRQLLIQTFLELFAAKGITLSPEEVIALQGLSIEQI